LKNIDQIRKEFHIEGRILHTQNFPLLDGKTRFKVCPIPAVKRDNSLMTVRSEGQFNT